MEIAQMRHRKNLQAYLKALAYDRHPAESLEIALRHAAPVTSVAWLEFGQNALSHKRISTPKANNAAAVWQDERYDPSLAVQIAASAAAGSNIWPQIRNLTGRTLN